MTELHGAFSDLLPASTRDPVVRVQRGPDHRPMSATAVGRIPASKDRVWNVLCDVERYAERVPLIDRVKVRGDVVDLALRFRVSFFSVGFSFESSIHKAEDRSLVLAYRSGEPKDIRIEYLVEPLEGEPNASALAIKIGFDPHSVGWLARYFLKHHPEIEYGIHSGCALALFESMRKATP